jgi:C4-dicarboxylate-specific signal transduction histidine kinase
MGKIIQLIEEHVADLPAYLTHDPKGRLVPEFIASLARHTLEERDRLIQEVTSLQKNIDHIKEIVSMQQSYATMIGVIEAQPAAQLMEDSLLMNAGALDRHDVNVVRDYQSVPHVMAEKGKVLQILINVIRNGKYACDEGGKSEKILTLRIQPGPTGFVHLSVQDNGIGISPENFHQLFDHGFTTRSYGHGFGLHSSANAAKEMHGSLTVASEGVGHGATFTLALPIAKPPPA